MRSDESKCDDEEMKITPREKNFKDKGSKFTAHVESRISREASTGEIDVTDGCSRAIWATSRAPRGHAARRNERARREGARAGERAIGRGGARTCQLRVRSRRGMSGHATMATTSTRMYPVRPVVVLPKECPHARPMYQMRSIHEDGRDDRRRRHDAADTAEAKMPDDIVTQVNRLLQVSVSRFVFAS